MELILGTMAPSVVAAVVMGIASLVAMTIAVAMCNLCRQSGGNDNVKYREREPTLTEVTSVSDNKHKSTTISNQVSVHEENEGSNGKTDSILRHSNGAAVRESKNGDRPTSHDQRALPAIPHAGSGHGLTTDEEEDVDEGHYDVISSRRRKASASQTTSNTASPSRQNLYEKVEDIDPTYAGIKSDSSDPGYAGVGPGTTSITTVTGAKENHPYAVVNGIGTPGYAHIADKTPSPNPRLSAVIALGVAPQASVETLDSVTSGSGGPPVPDKNFPVSDSEVELSSAVTPQEGTSPSLPPRNTDRNSNTVDAIVTGVVVGGSDTSSSSNQASSSNPSSPPISLLSSTISVAPSTGGNDSTDGAPAGKKKGPDYSSVTARESLANIRERQAAEMRAQNPPDAMYETVNYDAVKVPKSSSDLDRGQRNSLTSDLYAEIASASGENSTRSSMYARVGDVHAPTPPPVDLLRNLNTVPSPDDEPDPGYSMIRRTRPTTSAYPSSSGPIYPANNNHQQQTVLQDDSGAIYAVIDKTRKNRATIHVSENLESDLEGQLNANVYAQVNKHSTRDGIIAPGSVYDNTHTTVYQGSGARPKIRTRSVEDDSPYSNNTELKRKSQNSNFEDPYARIKEKEDPYAKVKDTDPYAQIKDTDPPYSRVKDPNNPYSRIKDSDPPYSKVKDSDSAGYSRIKDVNNLKSSSSEEVAGYSSIKDVAPSSASRTNSAGDPNYAVIPGDRLAPNDRLAQQATDSTTGGADPGYDHIPTDNVTTLRVAHGYATEISPDDADSADGVSDGNNNPNGMMHIGQHQVNQDFWSRREHLYEEITVGQSQGQPGLLGYHHHHNQGEPGVSRNQQVTVHHRSPQQQQYSMHRLSTDL